MISVSEAITSRPAYTEQTRFRLGSVRIRLRHCARRSYPGYVWRGPRKVPRKKTGYLWEACPGLEIHTRDGEVITVAFAKAPEARAALTVALER